MEGAVDYAAVNRAAEARIEREAPALAKALASDNGLIEQMVESNSDLVRDLARDLQNGTGDPQSICKRAASLRDPDGPARKGPSLLARAARAAPRVVTRDTRNNGIMPQPFAIVRDLRSEAGTLFAQPQKDALGHVLDPSFSNLPDTGTGTKTPAAVPCQPLMLFDAAMRDRPPKERGRGASVELRIWTEALLSVDPRDRATGPLRQHITMKDLVKALWPYDWSGPSRDGPRLLRALNACHNAVLPWTGGYWVAVRVVNYPDVRNPASPLVLDVELPPGSGVGPLVHRPTLRHYGVRDGYAYRLSLALAYHWNRHLTAQGKRLPPTIPVVERDDDGTVLGADGKPLKKTKKKGGGPVTHWNDPRAVRTGKDARNPQMERLPGLTEFDLLILGAPGFEKKDRRPRHRAKERVIEALMTMAMRGDVVLLSDARTKAWRVEPPDWWGNPNGAPQMDDAAPQMDDAAPQMDDAPARQPADLLGSAQPPRFS